MQNQKNQLVNINKFKIYDSFIDFNELLLNYLSQSRMIYNILLIRKYHNELKVRY